ncbi:unnamed protein product [Acanthoscelides obtectus]|uniref:Uncharacterized protein n=1 Tax=Acanthoscelides obtectus TaxID=200917 RepID=A0A9P0LNY3_ACAOB|nr:unnamed protein product [Acanthoscelides obtectus]CAK1620777.1 hypothetical protein AOBTE_LOCUS563 [Acanthoscelides obtectus]
MEYGLNMEYQGFEKTNKSLFKRIFFYYMILFKYSVR